jgi:hypothetical protein
MAEFSPEGVQGAPSPSGSSPDNGTANEADNGTDNNQPGAFSGLLSKTFQQLSDIEEVLGRAKANPEAVKLAQGLQQGLQQLVTLIGQSKAPQGTPPAAAASPQGAPAAPLRQAPTQDANAGRSGQPMIFQ